jgi:hypothetical protein
MKINEIFFKNLEIHIYVLWTIFSFSKTTLFHYYQLIKWQILKSYISKTLIKPAPNIG